MHACRKCYGSIEEAMLDILGIIEASGLIIRIKGWETEVCSRDYLLFPNSHSPLLP